MNESANQKVEVEPRTRNAVACLLRSDVGGMLIDRFGMPWLINRSESDPLRN